MGVLHDNLEEFDPAIKAYQNFLAVCRRTGDRIGEALAYNAIAVDFHLRGQRTANPKNYKMAVHYHTKHLSVADEQGQFVAHTNLGLAYSALSRVRRRGRDMLYMETQPTDTHTHTVTPTERCRCSRTPRCASHRHSPW